MKSSSCSRACSRTNTATFRPAPIRNPPTSSHTPGSLPGCTIFVKLWQFDLDDRTNLRLDTTTMSYVPDPERAGVELMPLFQDARESVRLERWAPNAEIILPMPGGIELLVLDGEFSENGDSFVAQSWLRLPAGAPRQARAAVWSGSRPAISPSDGYRTPRARRATSPGPGIRPLASPATRRNRRPRASRR